ncbi:uncharacterized protein LOC123316268 [Coccinella septempunctata]|uniref:uncharacterized protein LOC123316268 n=1 Tax=Coccinella septempunctata TaxID=41139 RepID=UPI001D08135B|nr:uncharacterized protein LOC123316268 [Coccinella septempunctata]
MKINLLVPTLIVTIGAITVPTVWPENQELKHLKPMVYGNYHRKIINNREDFSVYPQRIRLPQQFHYHRRPQKISKLPPGVQHFQTKRKKFYKKHKPRESVWTPIVPYTLSTKQEYAPDKSTSFSQNPRTHYKPASSEYVTSRSSPLYKNYRDDRTYEPEETNNDRLTDSSPDIDRPQIKESDHEHPSDIPTVPVYPGEGQWAKPGKKHKPYVSKQTYSKLKEDSNEEPEGYEVFLKGKKLYESKQAKFDESQSKEHPDFGNSEEHSEKQKDESETEEEEDFVPSTMYVQVRRSENEEHLPSDSESSEGGRLKEVIKDSKIHTVYTEEGYEDSAYDHAGHEKEAEDSEGYKEYKKEEKKLENPDVHDQNGDSSTTIYKRAKTNTPKKKEVTPKMKNKLYKTSSTKTMKLKEKPDGTQMELTNEIKTITNPDDEKTDKFVQTIPTVAKHQKKHNRSGELSNEESTNAPKRRRKRFTNDIPKINVKTDFINGVLEGDHQNFNVQEEDNKYPYYNSKYLNPNSPLRYSENLKNIPEKTDGRMAFYEQANRIQCPEVDEDIEAISERVQGVEKSVNSGEKLEDSEEAGKSPRLGKLGQRIDCFKRKYFGENPLDSPFFKEKDIETVPPVFKVLQERSAGFQAHHVKTKEPTNNNYKKKYHSKFSIRTQPSSSMEKQNYMGELDSDEIVNDVRIHEGFHRVKPSTKSTQSVNDELGSPEVEVINVDTFKSINSFTTESSPVSLITTPNYSVNITPKYIYDQIKLLDYLPSTADTFNPTENPRKGKLVEDVTEASQLKMRQNFIPRRPTRMRKKRPHFDVDSFVQDTSRRVTVTPNSYKTENNAAFYDQTPLDQMNVFADVLNNIRNGSNDPLRVDASTYAKPNHFQNTAIRMRVPPKKIRIKVPESVKYSNEIKAYYKTTTSPTTISPTTSKSKRGSVRYAITTEKEQNYDDYSDTEEDSDNDRRNIVVKTSTTGFPVDEADIEENEDSEVSGSHTTETIHRAPVKKVADIIGLVPPSKYHYRTIHQPVEELLTEPIVSESEVVNNYHVLGMKPPSTKQKVYDYSEFKRLFASKNTNNHKYHNHRRGKRSPNRKSYFEVVRGDNSEYEQSKSQEEDDDYVPHRPKNWHWDEKLKKIVYDKPREVENSDNDDEEDVVEETEVEDSTPRNIQQTTTRRSFTSTTPINGPSYVDFVKLLKSKQEYVSIPDPTTTKDGITMEATTATTTTVKTDPTKPPEFLSFVSKLRQSDSYKLIEDKNKTKTTSTTELPEEEEEEEEEEIEDTEANLSTVQNAPGRGAVDIGHNYKIFDVNEFLPKVKTYSPRTEIDYSKYKTIQRPRTQTTTQTSEVMEDGTKTTEKPNPPFKIEELDEERPISSTEGQLEIFELSRPTTASTTTTVRPVVTTTIQKIRRRRPTTTQRAIVSSATNTKEDVSMATHNKSKRFYPRKRAPHIRTRTTTPKSEEDAAPEESQKIVIRRHNTVERNPKIVSLESIIQLDQTNRSDAKINNKHPDNNVDDVLKNINRLKEVSIEEMVSDYSLGTRSDEEDLDGKDEDFEDDNTKIALDNNSTTDKKLVISKDKKQGKFYYTSVR